MNGIFPSARTKLYIISDNMSDFNRILDIISDKLYYLSILFIPCASFFSSNSSVIADEHTIYMFDLSSIDDTMLEAVLSPPSSSRTIFYDTCQTYHNAYRLILHGNTNYWHMQSDPEYLLNLFYKLPIATPSLCEGIRQYCNEHLDQPLSLEDLSNMFHLSPNYLSLLFKRNYGISIMYYIQTQRIERAKTLLCHSREKIIGISRQCGYSSAKYFNIAFKKAVGMTPGEYRKQHTHQSLSPGKANLDGLIVPHNF